MSYININQHSKCKFMKLKIKLFYDKVVYYTGIRGDYMWDKIKANTIMFISIVAFVKIFEIIFTPSNTLVGVTVIISILILMKENLTKNPVKNLLILLLINLSLGGLSHISSNNMLIGLIVNFFTLSIIGYVMSFELNKTMVVPFGLQYLFMLYSPITNDLLAKRFIALAFGAVLLMIVQFYVHRKDSKIKIESSQLIKFDKNTKKIHRVRASYAIRVGLVTAISAFLVSYFKIDQGRWIVYTVFALTELYSENCKKKSKQRLEGTIIGSLVVLILFIFIKSNIIRVAIILTAGYMDSYLKSYRDKMIFITISAVASTSLTNGTLETSIQRIVCVFMGVILALLVDKFVFRQKLSDC